MIALNKAIKHNKRNLAYVEGILKSEEKLKHIEGAMVISGQSKERAIEIAQGKVSGVPKERVAFFKRELKRRGVII